MFCLESIRSQENIGGGAHNSLWVGQGEPVEEGEGNGDAWTAPEGWVVSTMARKERVLHTGHAYAEAFKVRQHGEGTENWCGWYEKQGMCEEQGWGEVCRNQLVKTTEIHFRNIKRLCNIRNSCCFLWLAFNDWTVQQIFSKRSTTAPQIRHLFQHSIVLPL